ncbi:protein kinase [Candidatus Uabimicrobium sp. HlEnr_7]|uniref:protein kinase domain-containing protein n=1 Tax=Candidatus Uabimicrobium helgolandensis TaxID=3095367 RepID=UPI0035571D9A
MNYREQCLQNCAQALGYIDNSEILNISSSNANIQEYFRNQKLLSQSQLNYLKLFFIKYVFLSEAKNLCAFQQFQIDTILSNDIQNIRNNQHPQFGSFEKKITQHPSFSQVIPKLQQTLTTEEVKILKFMLGKLQGAPQQSVSSSDTQKGRSTSSEPASQKIEGIPAILGDYRILETIGVGGMGKVFKAYHQNLERAVAIKVMLNQTETARKRFLVEAKLTAKMQHPNIIPIHDIKSEGQLDYIVMDFIQGKTLSAVLEQENLSFAKTIEIIKPIISAVAYAHRYQVIHRDLKPANILLEEETFRPIVMDFGLAKQLEEKVDDQLTTAGQILGSPRYMAPEQAEAEEVDHRADIYALGTIFYEMLTGKSAIEGGSLAQVIYKITQKKYLPPRKINPEISIEIEKICLKSMALDREKRYQSADEFLKAVELFVDHGKSTIPSSVDNENKKLAKRKRRPLQSTVSRSRESVISNRKTASTRITQHQKKTQKNSAMIVILTCTTILLLTTLFFSQSRQSTGESKLQIEKELAQKRLKEEKQKFEQELQKQKEKAEKEKQKLKEELTKKEQRQRKPESLEDLVEYNDKGDYLKVIVKKISPALQNLRGKKRLIFLSFRNTRVRDEDLRYIQNISQIIALDLQETSVGNTAIKYAATLKRLQHLDLEGTNITGQCLKYLTNFQLRTIDLDETEIGDDGISHFKNIKSKLKQISLEGTNISDRSIPVLSSLTSLAKLKIGRTKITRSGFLKLKRLMPRCQVVYR